MNRERPIIFSAPMIREIRAGLKTQTRRIVKPQPSAQAKNAGIIHSASDSNSLWAWLDFAEAAFTADKSFRCPYGVPGDSLWVRETWQHSNHPLGPYDPDCTVFYRADYLDDPHGPDGERSREGKYRKWRPAIHMPRTASRLKLTVTDVRIERLQAINQADAIAEGIHRVGQRWEAEGICCTPVSAADAYRGLWEYINGLGSWAANPWVWALTFETVKS